jgi:hypothetical protein
MPISFNLRPDQLNDLSILRELGADAIHTITKTLAGLESPPVKPQHLRKELINILPTKTSEAEHIVRLLITLYSLRRQRDLSVQELLDGLTRGIRTADVKWTDVEISEWEELLPNLHDLLSMSTIWTIVKALDLSYDYANLFQSAKILTDIRPIFSEDASTIDGSVVSFTLRLYFDSLEGSKSLSIALNHKDVKKLQKNCERAIKKAETAKTFMVDDNKKRTIICGDEDDD